MDISNISDIKSVMSNVNAQDFAAKSARAGQQFQQLLSAELPAKRELTEAEINKIDKTAEEFEAIFISNMLEQMFTNTELEKPFGGGNSEGIYRSMLIGKYAENMTKGDGIGIASQLKDSMYDMQLGL
uniref:Flagellar protein FlgJ N-terminal domain-containing protein n=1 Tax=OCS116 cluster bacterium TaxID=2030921 RepID=A0A2A4Z1K5_9PROT